MNKVTSITLLNNNGMERISITYSAVGDDGVIIEDNKRINRVVVGQEQQELVSRLYQYAQHIIDPEGGEA